MVFPARSFGDWMEDTEGTTRKSSGCRVSLISMAIIPKLPGRSASIDAMLCIGITESRKLNYPAMRSEHRWRTGKCEFLVEDLRG